MTKMIEAKVAKEFASTFFGDPVLRMAVNAVVDNAPGFDLVRCKDCKNRDEITKECKHPKAVGWDVIIPEDNDFCSYGERRTDEA